MLFRKHLFSYSPESKKCGFEGYFIQTKHKQFPAKFSTEPSARGRRGGARLAKTADRRAARRSWTCPRVPARGRRGDRPVVSVNKYFFTD